MGFRVKKLEEEQNELIDALNQYIMEPTIENAQKVKDEMADCEIIKTQIGSFFGVYQKNLLDMAIDKVKGRQIDPNYKRYGK
jgi:hypothetical protein